VVNSESFIPSGMAVILRGKFASVNQCSSRLAWVDGRELSGKTAALEALPPLIFTARLAWGEKKRGRTLLRPLKNNNLKFFAGCTPNNGIRITQPAVLACHQLWLQAGDTPVFRFLQDFHDLPAVNFGRTFRPDDKMGAGDFFIRRAIARLRVSSWLSNLIGKRSKPSFPQGTVTMANGIISILITKWQV
jgi:hypothetical protein